MKKTLILISFTLFYHCSFAQTDQAAVKVLDKFSSTALAAPSVSLKFRIITLNQQDNTRDTTEGSLIMSKDQYRLELPDNITWFNGNTSWNYLVAEREVTIVKPDRKDDSFMSKPSSIFTLYKKGYKARQVEENTKTFIVDLYPEDINSDLVRIRLTIGKTAYSLDGAEYKRKDGITMSLIVNEYNLKVKPESTAFTFNPKNYKGVEVIDMR
jgi:outer membrane lipoprotein-sorting protein